MNATIILSASGAFSLGTNNKGSTGRIVAQFTGASWTGSIIPKIRVADGALALVSAPYFNLATRALVPAGTAITANGIFSFPVEGVAVVLDYTHTSGSCAVTFANVSGGDGASVVSVTGTVTADASKGVATISQVTSAVATSALLLAANATRKSAVIANKHATATLYINRATPAVITNMPIPAGQTFTDDLTVGAWYGITDAAATDARVIEVA